MSVDEQIEDISVQDELRTSFLSYAMSVIVARALPDVRDGMKPVHRRILYAMARMNLVPSKAHVKCARVVGEVMGKYHPHGDSAIYEALVRLAQDWSMRLPLVDGHGNFGTQTDGAAASRYTEARMAPAAQAMTDELDEETVDFVPNYDGSRPEPKVLPAAFPSLLVNGAMGIAVGMASSMPTHNLAEAVAACKLVLEHPDATLEEVMQVLPAPDLPTGGLLLGLDGVKDAYRTGRGSFVMRARTHVEDVSPRRKGIVITELPYQVGPENVIADIKKQRDLKRLAGVANVVDLSDRRTGLRMVVECKTGFQPQAVLDELLRTTRLQTNFHVHQLALVNGQPRTLTLLEMIRHYLDHRLDVVTRRCEFRRRKAQARAHLLEGFLIALARIEEVVRTIRASADTNTARDKLMAAFALSELQANAILEMPLRRLTNLEVEKITSELAELTAQIAELTHLLDDPAAMRTLIGAELDAVVARHPSPRRTTLSGASPTVAPVDEAAARVPDKECLLTVSASGLISAWAEPFTGTRTKHDALLASLATRTHATVAAITSTGRAVHISMLEVPTGAGKDRGGPVSEFVDLTAGEKIVGLVNVEESTPVLALATAGGQVKLLAAGELPKKSGQPVIGLKDGDFLVAAVPVVDPAVAELVFITSDGQLLRTPAAAVRPQGRTGGGVAGVKLADGAQVLAFAVAGPGDAELPVVTVAGGSGVTSAKCTPLSAFPAKGRATGGVRAHRLARGEDRLVAAGVGKDLVGVSPTGALVALPAPDGKRDGAGVRTSAELAAVATRR